MLVRQQIIRFSKNTKRMSSNERNKQDEQRGRRRQNRTTPRDTKGRLRKKKKKNQQERTQLQKTEALSDFAGEGGVERSLTFERDTEKNGSRKDVAKRI